MTELVSPLVTGTDCHEIDRPVHSGDADLAGQVRSLSPGNPGTVCSVSVEIARVVVSGAGVLAFIYLTRRDADEVVAVDIIHEAVLVVVILEVVSISRIIRLTSLGVLVDQVVAVIIDARDTRKAVGVSISDLLIDICPDPVIQIGMAQLDARIEDSYDNLLAAGRNIPCRRGVYLGQVPLVGIPRIHRDSARVNNVVRLRPLDIGILLHLRGGVQGRNRGWQFGAVNVAQPSAGVFFEQSVGVLKLMRGRNTGEGLLCPLGPMILARELEFEHDLVRYKLRHFGGYTAGGRHVSQRSTGDGIDPDHLPALSGIEGPACRQSQGDTRAHADTEHE